MAPPCRILQVSNGSSISYLDKHECGNGSGINLIYLGGGIFIGLGTNPIGMTIKELYSLLVDEYNKKPIPKELLYSTENLSLHDDVILENPGKEDLVMSLEEFQKVLAHKQKLYEEGALPEAPSEQTVHYLEKKLKRKANQKELADHQISLEEFENSLPKIVQASAPFLGLTKLRQLHDKMKKRFNDLRI